MPHPNGEGRPPGAGNHGGESAMRTERRTTSGAAQRWSRCVVGSGAAHLVLFGACLLLQPGSEDARAVLRVRLIPDAAVVPPVASETGIRQTATPPQDPKPFPQKLRRRVARTGGPTSSVPTAAPSRVEPLPAPTSAAGVSPDPPVAPDPPPATPVGAPPAPAPAASPDPERSASPPGPVADGSPGDARGTSGPPDVGRPAGPGGSAGSAAATDDLRAASRGAYLLAGQGGTGAGDGHGAGSATGPGRGSGAGSVGSGGTEATAGRAAPRGDGNGAGHGAPSGDQLLRAVRRQIERVWTYPDAARRDGLEGTVWLRFRVAGDGSVDTVEVVKSSGHRLLDDDLAQTVRRAAPYPTFAGWFRFPFTYRLAR